MEREENKGSLVSHPMRERSAAYRYRYCFGLGVLAMGNMRAIMEYSHIMNGCCGNYCRIRINTHRSLRILIMIWNDIWSWCAKRYVTV